MVGNSHNGILHGHENECNNMEDLINMVNRRAGQTLYLLYDPNYIKYKCRCIQSMLLEVVVMTEQESEGGPLECWYLLFLDLGAMTWIHSVC